jgi:OFA family oxalate/formate antiporter-like MFS transporter
LNTNKKYGFLSCGTLSMLILGLVYAWSIFSEHLALTNVESSFVFSISMVMFCVGSIVGAQISSHASVRIAAITSAVLLVVGFAGCVVFAQGDTPGFITLLVFYGVGVGLASGIGYNAILTTVNLWFPGRTGFATGVQLLGYGISSLILGTACHAAINSFGWRAVFLALAIIGAVILLVAAVVIKKPGAKELLAAEKQQANGARKSVAQLAQLKADEAATKDDGSGVDTPGLGQNDACDSDAKNVDTPAPRAKAGMRRYLSSDLILFYIWRIVCLGACITLVGSSAASATALGFDPNIAAVLVGIVGLMNGLNRIFTGLIYDRTSIRFVMGMVTGLVFVGSACVAIAFLTATGWLFFVAAILLGLAYGSCPVCSSTYARERFGAADYAQGLGILNSNVALGSFLSMIIIAIIGTASGAATYIVFTLLDVLAFICLLAFIRSQRTS